MIKLRREKVTNLRAKIILKSRAGQTESNTLGHHFPLCYRCNRDRNLGTVTLLSQQKHFFLSSFLLAPPRTLTPPFHHFLEQRGATKPHPSDTMEYKRQGIHATLLSEARTDKQCTGSISSSLFSR